LRYREETVDARQNRARWEDTFATRRELQKLWGGRGNRIAKKNGEKEWVTGDSGANMRGKHFTNGKGNRVFKTSRLINGNLKGRKREATHSRDIFKFVTEGRSKKK